MTLFVRGGKGGGFVNPAPGSLVVGQFEAGRIARKPSTFTCGNRTAAESPTSPSPMGQRGRDGFRWSAIGQG